MDMALWTKTAAFTPHHIHPKALGHGSDRNGGLELFQFFVGHLDYQNLNVYKYNKITFKKIKFHAIHNR